MRILGTHLAPGRVVLAARPGHGARHEPELDGVVVGDEQEASRPGSADADVLGAVLDAGAAAAERARHEVGAGRVDVPALRRCRGSR